MKPIYKIVKEIKNNECTLNEVEEYLLIENNLLMYHLVRYILASQMDSPKIRERLKLMSDKMGDEYLDGGYALGSMGIAGLVGMGDFSIYSLLSDDDKKPVDSLLKIWGVK